MGILRGGEYDGDRQIDDLKLLYTTYATDALSGGRMEEIKLAALNQLRNIFGLGRREAESIVLEVTAQAYRRRLQLAVSSGELLKSNSKAVYLQNLCEELRFDPEKAIEIHEVALAAGILGGAAYGLLAPIFATFQEVEEGKLEKLYHCLFV